jgi:hypothetical protein
MCADAPQHVRGSALRRLAKMRFVSIPLDARLQRKRSGIGGPRRAALQPLHCVAYRSTRPPRRLSAVMRR